MSSGGGVDNSQNFSARLIAISVALVVAGGLIGVPQAAAQTPSAPPVERLANSVVPAVANGELQPISTPANAPDHSLTLTLTLNRTEQSTFASYLASVENPKSPDFRHFLTQKQLANRFGPSSSEYKSVLGWLQSQGFKLVRGSANRLTITVRASRAEAERAFGVQVDEYSSHGRSVYANTGAPSVPSALSPYVHSVSGLSDLAQPSAPQPQDILVKCAKGGNAKLAPYCTQALKTVNAACQKLVSLGDATGPLEPMIFIYCLFIAGVELGDVTGGGAGHALNTAVHDSLAGPSPAEKIGLLEYDNYNVGDVSNFLQLYGLPAVLVNDLNEVDVDGGAGLPGADETEVLLDIDSVLALTNGHAQVTVYDASSSTSFESLFNEMINDGDTVISNSWSSCENEVSLADAQSINSVLEQAAASGISVFNGSGDSGSTCLDGSPDTAGVPADSPNATAVGGSTLTVGPGLTVGSESWWNGSGSSPPTGQGGFGVSQYFSRPSYQDGLTTSVGRSVPDVVGPADPFSDGIELCQADDGGCPDGLLVGGTSLTTPEWAAMVANVDGELGSGIGNVNSVLYPLDGTSAFNGPTQMGSDFAHVGLGDAVWPQLLLALKHTTAGSVSPTVSDNVAIGAADALDTDGQSVPADGSTTGTVQVNLYDADGDPVSGQSVSLRADAGCNASISTPSGTSDSTSGAVTFSVTDTVPESCTFTAKDTTDGITLSTQSSLTFVPPTATGAEIYASPPQVPDDGTTQATITVYLENGLDQPAAGKTVSLSQTGSAVITPAGSSTPGTTAVTDSAGNAVFNATDTNAENVQFTASDTADGNLPVPGSASVTFYSGPPPTCTSSPVAASGYSVSTVSSGYKYDPYDQVLPGNFNVNACDGLNGLAFDSNGDIYASDYYTGTINVIPPGGGAPSISNQLPDTNLGSDDITSLAFGKGGELYATLELPPPNGINDNEDPEVVQLDPATGAIVRVVVSQGLTYCPSHLTVDPLSGDLFVSGGCNGYLETQDIDRISDPSGPDPTVSVYANTSGYGQDGIPYGLAFAPNGTLYAIAGGNEILAIGGTNTTQPATITPVVQFTSGYGLNLAIDGTSGGAATSLMAQDFSGNIYSIDLTKSPPTISSPILTGEGYNDGFLLGPDSCLYFDDPSTVYRFGAGSDCGSSGNVSTTPSLTLSSTSSLSSLATGSSVTFTAQLNNVASPAGTPILFTVSGANPQVKLVDANANGEASFTYSALHPGTDAVAAAATVGTAVFNSNPISFTWVAGIDTSFLTLNGSQEIGPVGSPATFDANLSDISQNPATPINGATVDVTVGTQSCTITTDGSGSGSCQVSPSTGGLLPVTANYDGSQTLTTSSATDSFFAGGPSTIAPPTPPGFTNAASDTVPSGTAFTFRVTTTGSPTPAITLASGSSLPNGVTLTDNGDGTATLAGTSTVAPNTYTFSIQAANGVSPDAIQPFTLTVTNTATTTTLTPSVNPSVRHQPVSFTATVTPNSGEGSPTGTVTFSVDGVAQSPAVRLSGGKAVFTTSKLKVGTHTITASYSGGHGFVGGNSNTVTQKVKSFGPPASIAIEGGSSQSATIGTSFLQPLAVRVLDAYSNPVSKSTVSFRAPRSGASGTFAGGTNVTKVETRSNGIATAPTFTANETAGGPYRVVATVKQRSVDFDLTNVRPPQDTGVSIAPDSLVIDGQPSPAFRITASNTGRVPTSGDLVVTDHLQSGMSFTGVYTNTGWDCNFKPQAATCTYTDSIRVGRSADLDLVVDVTAPPGTLLSSTVTLTPNDATPQDNTAYVEVEAGDFS